MTHQNGHPYLWCGKDYQGYTCIDLDTCVLRDYVPPEASEGGGFCWIDVLPNSSGTILAVHGCYWAAPYGIHFYDFSDPDQWPLLPLGVYYPSYDTEYDTYGWDGNDFVYVFKCEKVTFESYRDLYLQSIDSYKDRLKNKIKTDNLLYMKRYWDLMTPEDKKDLLCPQEIEQSEIIYRTF